jgi:hypothetical protein
MMPSEVKKLATNLRGRQPEEIPGGRRTDLAQRPAQTQQCVLQDVAGSFFPADGRKSMQHFAGKPLQAVATTVDQFIKRGIITLLETSNQIMQTSGSQVARHENRLDIEARWPISRILIRFEYIPTLRRNREADVKV